jgi:glyoxylase-like metal-dependent hydrolase (beta-lactamase superfamily II)
MTFAAEQTPPTRADTVRVERVAILPMGLVNAHLVAGPAGLVLVDAGLPDTEQRVAATLARMGAAWRDIKLIVVTHAHIDHAGNAARLRELTGAPICAHHGDLDHYLQRRPMGFCSTGPFGRLFLKTGLIKRPYAAFEPDLLLRDNERLSLERFGLDGEVAHTPGHTDGSISVQLGDGQALVGDLLSSGILLGGIVLKGRAKRPPFEDDAHSVKNALEEMLQRGARHFYMGHGGPLPAAEVRRHASALGAEG